MSAYKKFAYDLRLDGKVAVVTGGTSGIGQETARMLAWKGATVIIFGRNPKIHEIAAQLGPKVTGINVDITQTTQIAAAVDQVIKMNGAIDIMNVLNVNLKSAFMVAQCVGRTMLESGRGGRIINIASDAGVVALKDHIAYSASKAGLISVTRTLALEWGPYGITTNAVSPCVVMTPMSKAYWVGEKAEKHLAQIPVGRFLEMDEVAACIAFLASDGAQMINGQNIVIDGGYTAI